MAKGWFTSKVYIYTSTVKDEVVKVMGGSVEKRESYVNLLGLSRIIDKGSVPTEGHFCVWDKRVGQWKS